MMQESVFYREVPHIQHSPIQQGGSDGGRTFGLEFRVSTFRHNFGIACLLLPCLPSVVSLAGTLALTLLLSGLVMSYILDYLKIHEWTLFAFWGTLGAVWMAMVASNLTLLVDSWLNLFVFLNASGFLLLCGLWASVQFQWLQRSSPEVMIISERILFALAPIVTLPLYFDFIVGMTGAARAPLFTCIVMCIVHHIAYSPKRSSWKVAAADTAKEEELIQSRVESFMMSVVLLVVPTALHILLLHRVMHGVGSIIDCVAMFLIPLHYLLLDPPTSMWWMFPAGFASMPAREQRRNFFMRLRPVLLVVAHVILLQWFSERVVMKSFRHLLLGMPPPMNSLLLFLGLCAASLTIIISIQLTNASARTGTSPTQRSTRLMVVLASSMAAAFCFSFVVGLPSTILPFPALAAVSFLGFCLERAPNNNYHIFVFCSACTLLWWCFKAFAFLPISVPALFGVLQIQLVVLADLFIVLFVMSAVIFAHAISPTTKAGTGAAARMSFLLIIHAAVFTFMEHTLYSTPDFYPSIMVFITSIVGVVAASRLNTNGKLTFLQSALVSAFHAVRPVLYIAWATTDVDGDGGPGSGNRKEWAVAELGLLWITSLGAAACLLVFHVESIHNRKRARPSLGHLYCLFAGLSVLVARHSIVGTALKLFMGVGQTEGGAGLARVYGVSVIMWGALCVPVSFVYLRHIPNLSRMNALVIVAGAAMALLQPSVGFVGAADEELGSELNLYHVPVWVEWLGVVAMVSVLCTLLGVVTMPGSTGARAVWWAILSAMTAVSFVKGFLPFAPITASVFVCVVFFLLALVLELSHFPAGDNRFQPALILYGAFSLSLVFTFATVVRSDFSSTTHIAALAEEGRQFSLSAVTSFMAVSNLFLAVVVKCRISGRPLLHFGANREKKIINSTSASMLPLGAIVNFSVLTALCSLSYMNIKYNDASTVVFVLLGSLLLLLHPDNLLFKDFNPTTSQYLPPMLHIDLLLASTAILDSLRMPTAVVIRDFVCLFLLVPSHSLLWTFLHNGKPPRFSQGLVACLLAVVAIVVNGHTSVTWLAVIGFSACAGAGLYSTYRITLPI